MNVQFYVEKLKSTKEFKDFKKENPKSYLCSGFFVFDKEKAKNPDNKIHFDFYNPETKKAFSFEMDDSIKIVQLENFNKIPGKINEDVSFDFDEIEGVIGLEMQNKNLKEKIQKIILSMSNVDEKIMLNVVVFISMLGMLKINISLPEKKIVEFEKKSFFDMFKVVQRGKKD